MRKVQLNVVLWILWTSLLLKHTVRTISDPFVITQHFGDIPEEYQTEVLNKVTNNSKDMMFNIQP